MSQDKIVNHSLLFYHVTSCEATRHVVKEAKVYLNAKAFVILHGISFYNFYKKSGKRMT